MLGRKIAAIFKSAARITAAKNRPSPIGTLKPDSLSRRGGIRTHDLLHPKQAR